MISFSKMHGLGNKIIVLDMRAHNGKLSLEAITRLAQDREMSFDQIMAISLPVKSMIGPLVPDYRIDIYNADGSLSQACGNGTRCVVEWLYQQGLGSRFTFETMADCIEGVRNIDGSVSVNMGQPRFDWQAIPTSVPCDTKNVAIAAAPFGVACLVSMGNPHAIYFMGEEIAAFPLAKYGPAIEHDALFPEKCNVSIVHVINYERLHIRTWERGVGITAACGSAACAALVAAHRHELVGRVAELCMFDSTTQSFGKSRLFINWQEDNHVIMTGPTAFEFSGFLDPGTGIYHITQYLSAGRNMVYGDTSA